jgi:hypothetical protein
MMRKIVILSVMAMVPSMANADAVVRIRSDQPANAFLDGKLAGATPLVLSKIKSGTHVVKVENAESGEVKIYNVYSPKTATSEKDIDVEWQQSAAAQPVQVQPEPTTEVVRTTVVQPAPVVVQPVPVVQTVPVVYAPARVYPGYGYRRPYGRGYDSRYAARQYQEERDKVRSRNVLLGAAAANEIFNKGGSKGTVRGVTLGGALLNEVLRSGR